MKKAMQQHIDFLENTLIPDLEESGREFTADDFNTCIGFMKRLMYENEQLKKRLKAKSKKKAKVKR